jgi:16S rRNA processing protein RimM
MTSAHLVLGRIGRPHGLRGEVTVEVRTDDPEGRFAVGAELATDPSSRGPLTVVSQRRISGNTVLGFEGYPDRNAAETLRGTLLVVEAEELPELPDDDDFYDHQLIGLAARLAGEDEPFGEVIDVLHLPASDVLSVRTDRVPSGELLIPFVRAIVPEVDLAAGNLTVDPPDGLFD